MIDAQFDPDVDPTTDGLVSVMLREPEIQRVLYLTHQDIALAEGKLLIARRKLASKTVDGRLSSSEFKKAMDIVKNTPRHLEVLYGAKDGFREALSEARQRGLSG